MHELRQHVIDSGFAFPETLIHLFVGGSELHGAKVHGTDDLDIYGAYVEPPVLILGFESMPHFVWSTSGNEQRNGSHDVDITLYSLRKWAGLACKRESDGVAPSFRRRAAAQPNLDFNSCEEGACSWHGRV